MHKRLLYAGYGYMAFSAVMNYMADVLQPYLRHQRASGTETTLYCGMHSAFNFGQLIFGLTAILLLRSGSDFLSRRPGEGLAIAVIGGLLAICFAYIKFAPPKINLAVVLALLVSAAYLNI